MQAWFLLFVLPYQLGVSLSTIKQTYGYLLDAAAMAQQTDSRSALPILAIESSPLSAEPSK
ncbi:hypothetical protein [Psychrobacter celer]|uniref:hypothetical protein n=1 Tax=Psychrobacter celer TaxID=306572 RepID=UPI00264C8183|nr:hypothetical protein [Psychrobacter sp.]